MKAIYRKTASKPLLLIALLLGLWVLEATTGCNAAPQPSTEGGATATMTSTQTNPVAEGRAVFVQKCMPCHTVNGQGGHTGPDLTHESAPSPGFTTTDYRDFYSLWLDNPKNYKPDARMPKIPLTPAEKQAVIAYLMSLT